MASIDVMSLSSPLRPPSNLPFTMSSSPGLPSPSQLFKMAPLRTGSRAAKIPTSASANATFTTASSLHRASPQENHNIESIRKFKAPAVFDQESVAEEATTKPKARKSRAKKPVEDEENKEKKQAPTRRKKAVPVADDAGAKEKVVRKPRAKKVEDQTQLPSARVTKSSSGKGNIKEKGKKVLDSGIDTRLDEPTTVKVSSLPITETPVSVGRGSTSKTPPLFPGKAFSGLLNDFGYRNGEVSQQQQITNQVTPEVLGARKRKSPDISKTDSIVAKPKALRKKAKTITDQATAAYVTEPAEVEVELPNKPGAITDFFTYKPKAGEIEKTTSDGSKSSLKLLKPLKSSRLKPGDQGLPILLSPESAIKQCNKQDVLFGTSSQLAREDSPSLLRDLHAAMRVSNAIDDDYFMDSTNDSCKSTSTSQRLLSRVGKTNLWSASSRDQSGELLNVEVVDLSTTPVAKVKSTAAHLSTDGKAAEVTRKPIETNSDTRDVGDTSVLRIPVTGDDSEVIISATDGLDMAPKKADVCSPAKTQKSKPATTRKPNSNAKKAASDERPDYSAFSTDQLTKAVGKFGFKTVKRREQMITLLNKCWEGKHGVKPSEETADGEAITSNSKPSEQAGTSVATAAAVQVAHASPKKPRGRPKKVVEADPSLLLSKKIASSQPVVNNKTGEAGSDSEDKPLILRKTSQKGKAKDISGEISDSDTAMAPSPSRRKGYKKRTPALPLKSAEGDDALDDKAPSSQAELYFHITKAVKSAPLSTSSTEPNWYEKMLLYDPIVLEDLTIWLNTGGLEKAGWDGEVNPLEVKGWCESNSVCCLWRENLRGGARNRY